ncbi:MAG: hypothetical protein JSS61_02540 [Verrucomicrobia bacterium]|nr:hypothetical protein [Verrucomicrobiota bacterium]
MKKLLLCLLLAGCASRTTDSSQSLTSIQFIDRNGFTETMSSKDRIASYAEIDFLKPQPYEKVLRVYGRNLHGQSTSKITSYHDNGLIWQYLEVVDGRAHGMYRQWHPNGQLHIEANVIEGTADIHELAQATWIFDGVCKVWDDEGNLSADIPYVKGALADQTHYYFPSGAIQQKIPYEQGLLEGALQVFDKEGALIEETHYHLGKKHGPAFSPNSQEEYQEGLLMQAKYFDLQGSILAEIQNGIGIAASFENGTLSSLTEYKKGIPEGEVRLFLPSGALHCSYFIKEGMKTGEEWEYYPNTTKPKICLHWNEDRIQGTVKTWYENGQMESQREIHDNKKQGLSFAWYKTGDLMLMEEYENDLLLKGSYYKRGEKTPISKIDAGEGTATLYTSEGFLLKKIGYEKGKPQLGEASS